MIEARQISKSFGRVRALAGVSFRVEPGQVVGLLGRNGAGKSTAMRIVTGYLHPDAGRANVCGLDTVGRPVAARARVGYLPESGSAHPEMSVRDYLRYRARLHGLAGRRLRAALDRVFDRCGLGEVTRRRTGQLSKGFRQRVGLASALIHDPPVLVLDEPSSGLDPAQVRSMRSLVRELGETKAVIVSSHILSEVEATCDRVLVIASGELRADLDLGGLDGERSSACLVELRVPTGPELAAALSLLRSVRGVKSAEVEGPVPEPPTWARFRVTPSEGAGDVREGIGVAVQRAGLALRELRRERLTLEELFLRHTEGSE